MRLIFAEPLSALVRRVSVAGGCATEQGEGVGSSTGGVERVAKPLSGTPRDRTSAMPHSLRNATPVVLIDSKCDPNSFSQGPRRDGIASVGPWGEWLELADLRRSAIRKHH